MPWRNDPGKRRRDAAVYRDPQFTRNAAIVRRRANGRCEKCGRHAQIQVDHIVPVSATGQPDHSLSNLQGLCPSCHAAKSAAEGHAARRRQAPRPAPRPRTQW